MKKARTEVIWHEAESFVCIFYVATGLAALLQFATVFG